MTSDPVIASLRAAVELTPDDVFLRLHLAELLVQSGQPDEAVRQAAEVLRRDPTNVAAIGIIAGPLRAAEAVRPSGDRGVGR